MNTLAEFEALASETGIALPSLLRGLLASGKTVYGPDWASVWREKSLQGASAFISWYDFEWIDALDARREIESWLNPKMQDGKVFLPFAQSGSGDVYCLMPFAENSVGVALIWHDNETSKIDYCSFDDFVAIQFFEAFADLDHHADEFSQEEILQCIASDVSSVTEFMDEDSRNYLRSFCKNKLVRRAFRYRPKSEPRDALSLVSQEQLGIECDKFQMPIAAPFTMVARWEVGVPADGTGIADSECTQKHAA
ncbi:MAG: SMI1/KNR4 family protein, partial [Giesbergeria sp.]